MTPPAPLPRRQPGTHLPRLPDDQDTRYVGRAAVPGASRWSVDGSTLLRLLDALQAA